MLKALILGLAISCLLLGIECLAVEQIKLTQGNSRIVIIPKIFGWLLIGIGSSTTLYTLVARWSSPTGVIATDNQSDSHHQWDATDYDLTEHYHDDEQDDDESDDYNAYEDDADDTTTEEDYFETDEEDESQSEFDLEEFNQQFDSDELLEE
ncbi:MAG: hypothetical protein HN617_01830 [Planctomycetaceae bacterium]|jgi:hypothetical protein|nr:hypothetical protein [Planctomycetaceae bacterium]MBT4723809.1 hypothetical protein [Planctomycetaceae bacterium]MBT4844973.1 hypothetical protein [Planctomycetaceae bacterium]MBT5126371.1 hypothetical protein [Planctomycetaceae bacterium]MBT5600267.1 hypothetical protein [Planctomycetaceae bacterium]